MFENNSLLSVNTSFQFLPSSRKKASRPLLERKRLLNRLYLSRRGSHLSLAVQGPYVQFKATYHNAWCCYRCINPLYPSYASLFTLCHLWTCVACVAGVIGEGEGGCKGGSFFLASVAPHPLPRLRRPRRLLMLRVMIFKQIKGRLPVTKLRQRRVNVKITLAFVQQCVEDCILTQHCHLISFVAETLLRVMFSGVAKLGNICCGSKICVRESNMFLT